jgi:hypothetical protein
MNPNQETPMIEIRTFRKGYGLVATAEATTPENAIYAAQVQFREAIALFDCQGVRKNISTTFIVDGQVVRAIDGKYPS